MSTGPAEELKRITALQKDKDFERALIAVDKALECFPANLLMSIKRGLILRKLQRVAESVLHLSALAEQHSSDPRVNHELSVSLRFSGEHERSLQLTNKVLNEHPEHRPSHLARVDTYIQTKNFEEALIAVDKALERFPANLLMSIKRGLILRKLQRVAESVSHLSALAERHPSDPRVNHELAVSLRFAGEYERSLEVTDSILRLHPEHRPSHLARVDTHAYAQNLEGVLAQVRTARESFEAKGDAYHSSVLSHHIFVALRQNRSILSNERWVWDFLLANMDLQNSDQLIAAYETSLVSQVISDDGPSRIIQTLFEKPTISSKACEKILNILHSNQTRDFKDLASRIIRKAPEVEKSYLSLYVISLTNTAGEALKLRKQYLPAIRSMRDCLFLHRMLRQAGKIVLSARYIKLVDRHMRDSVQIKAALLTSLSEAGDITRLRHELRILPSDLNASATKFMHVAINGFINSGELEKADSLYEAAKGKVGNSLGLLNQMIRVKHSLGREKEAQDLIRKVKARSQTPAALHHQPSLIGAMQGEMETARLGRSIPDTRKLTCNVSSGIRKAASEIDPTQNIRLEDRPQRVIHQYWNTRELPQDIKPLIEKWKDVDGFEHRLYSETSARQIIHDELGLDWAKAFDFARSPAEQSDFFRLCILMLRGGIYVDCDDAPTGNIEELYGLFNGFTLFAEPFGYVANNFIAGVKGHILARRAAISAKVALSRKHNENTWFKTGPGLLSRVTHDLLYEKENIKNSEPVTVYQRHVISRYVQFHVPLPYKRTKFYWNNSNADHAYVEMEKAARRLEVA